MKTKGYSIFLIPSGEFYKSLSLIIKKFSESFGTPLFEPHVTLLGGIIGKENEIKEKTHKLSLVIDPITIVLKDLDYQDYYLKSLIIEVEHSKDLMNANKAAERIFRIKDQNNYQPHLSLLYGDISIQAKKQSIKNLGNNIKGEFTVDSIYLVNAEGFIQDWKKIGGYRLKGSTRFF